MWRRVLDISTFVLSIRNYFVTHQHHEETIELSETHHEKEHRFSYAASINEHQNKADDDEYEQKNNEVQTIMLLASLFMQGGFQIISSSQTTTIFFTLSLALSISLLFLSVFTGLSTINRMATFMGGRARERNRQFRKIRHHLIQRDVPEPSELLRTNPYVMIQGVRIETFHDWFTYKCSSLWKIHLYTFKVGSCCLMITMISMYTNLPFMIPILIVLCCFLLLEARENNTIEWELPV
jgi:hypothetical protein